MGSLQGGHRRLAPFHLDRGEIEPASRGRDRHVPLDAPARHHDGGAVRMEAGLAAADGAVVYGDGGIENVQLPYPGVADLDIAAAVQDQPDVLAGAYLVAFVPAGPVAAPRHRAGG